MLIYCLAPALEIVAFIRFRVCGGMSAMRKFWCVLYDNLVRRMTRLIMTRVWCMVTIFFEIEILKKELESWVCIVCRHNKSIS